MSYSERKPSTFAFFPGINEQVMNKRPQIISRQPWWHGKLCASPRKHWSSWLKSKSQNKRASSRTHQLQLDTLDPGTLPRIKTNAALPVHEQLDVGCRQNKGMFPNYNGYAAAWLLSRSRQVIRGKVAALMKPPPSIHRKNISRAHVIGWGAKGEKCQNMYSDIPVRTVSVLLYGTLVNSHKQIACLL